MDLSMAEAISMGELGADMTGSQHSLEWTQSAGIDVDVRIYLDRRDDEAFALQ